MRNKGFKHSMETKRKISSARKKQIPPMTDKKHSEKTRAKMSKSAKGRIPVWIKGKPISEEHKIKIGRANSGSHSNLWKGGITPLVKFLRTCYKYRQWRSDVFTRDDFTCQECLLKSGCGKTVYLEAHHIKRFSVIIEQYGIKTKEDALNCEELWNINNGLTLCSDCHNKTKKGRKTL